MLSDKDAGCIRQLNAPESVHKEELMWGGTQSFDWKARVARVVRLLKRPMTIKVIASAVYEAHPMLLDCSLSWLIMYRIFPGVE